jgi:GcrA cell cycle regulator
MAWTEDRVETLKKLWADGLSASQIAKQLGGVTRNAVIGKVHRLGLSGRATPSRPARRPRPARSASGAQSLQPRKPAPRPPLLQRRNLSLLKPSLRPMPAPQEAQKLPSGEYATVLTLREGMCKWPIGDPTRPSSAFAAAIPASATPIAKRTPSWPTSRRPSAAASRATTPRRCSTACRRPAASISRRRSIGSKEPRPCAGVFYGRTSSWYLRKR